MLSEKLIGWLRGLQEVGRVVYTFHITTYCPRMLKNTIAQQLRYAELINCEPEGHPTIVQFLKIATYTGEKSPPSIDWLEI